VTWYESFVDVDKRRRRITTGPADDVSIHGEGENEPQPRSQPARTSWDLRVLCASDLEWSSGHQNGPSVDGTADPISSKCLLFGESRVRLLQCFQGQRTLANPIPHGKQRTLFDPLTSLNATVRPSAGSLKVSLGFPESCRPKNASRFCNENPSSGDGSRWLVGPLAFEYPLSSILLRCSNDAIGFAYCSFAALLLRFTHPRFVSDAEHCRDVDGVRIKNLLDKLLVAMGFGFY